MAATIKYFGRFPTTMVLQSSSNFDGTAQTGTPTLAPGIYTFPAQAGGGLYNFHEVPIEVKQIAYSGGGTCTVTKVVGPVGAPVQSVVMATLSSGTPADQVQIYLSPGEALLFSSSGGTNPVLSITAHEAAYASDGAC